MVVAIIVVLVYAADLTVSVPQAAPKWIAWLMPVLDFVRSGLPRTPFSAALVLALILLIWLEFSERRRQKERIEAARQSREEPVSQSEPTAELETLVPAESVERLREVYKYWAVCFDLAFSFLDERLCRTSSFWVGERENFERNTLIARLIGQYLLPPLAADKNKLDHMLASAKGAISRSDFATLTEQFGLVVNVGYKSLCEWIITAGGVLVGDKLYFAERYATLYESHRMAVRDLDRAGGRQDLKDIAHFVEKLAVLLPAPLRRDVKVPLSESLNELRSIAAWEGASAIIGHRWVGVLSLNGSRSNNEGCIYVEGDDGRNRFNVNLERPIPEPWLEGRFDVEGTITAIDDRVILSQGRLCARWSREIETLGTDEQDFLRLLCQDATDFEGELEHPAMMDRHLYNAAQELKRKKLGSITLLGENATKERFVLDSLVRAAVGKVIGCELRRTELVLDWSQIQGTGASGGGAEPWRPPLP